MKNRATYLLSIGLLVLAFPVFAGPPANAGVTRTQIEGVDNWGWRDNPLSPGTITCPGGELMFDSFGMPYCEDSKTGRLHFRDSVLWSCMTSRVAGTNDNDPRMTGIGLFTVNGNLDADSSGPVWGKWKIVPMADCDKDGLYPEEHVMTSTKYWRGTWNGTRLYYNFAGFDVWIGDLKIVGKGIGGDIDGLHFKGSELIEMYTPFPVPYEFLLSVLPDLFDEPEGEFTGTIKE